MTLEESWKLKTGDKVLILKEGRLKGNVATIPWDDRLYDEEPIPVYVEGKHPKGYYSLIHYKDLQKV